MWHKQEIILCCCCVTFYYEIIVYSHAVVRNSTKRSHIPPIRFPPVVASFLTADQYHNQEIDIDEIHWFDSDFTSCMCTHLCLLLHVLFCSMTFYTVRFVRFVWPPPESRWRTAPSQESRVLPFHTHSHPPPFFLFPNSWQLLIFSP